MTRTIHSARGYMTSHRYWISSAQSSAVRRSRTEICWYPVSGSTMAKILQVPLRLYSASIFSTAPGRIGSDSRTSPRSCKGFSSRQTTGRLHKKPALTVKLNDIADHLQRHAEVIRTVAIRGVGIGIAIQCQQNLAAFLDGVERKTSFS